MTSKKKPDEHIKLEHRDELAEQALAAIRSSVPLDPHDEAFVVAYGAAPPRARIEGPQGEVPLRNVPADIIVVESVSEHIETALVLLNEIDFPHPEHANARTKLFEAKEWIRRGMNRLR